MRRPNPRFVLGSVSAAVIAIAIAHDVAHGDMGGIDFHTYLAAAVVGMHHGWAHVYDQGLVVAAQRALVPHLWTQPFFSPPPVAWLAAPFTALPYQLAVWTWALITLVLLVASLAWSTAYNGAARWLAVAAAIVPWWVMHSIHVGQIAPLIAASVIVAWRLLRDEHDVAAGLVLVALVLKPNTAVFVPVALLLAGRMKAAAALVAGVGAVIAASAMALGPYGVTTYVGELAHVPADAMSGATQLTLATGLGLSGAGAAVARLAVAAVTIVTMYRLRREPGMAMACAAVGSLLTTGYLHASDLCLLLAAGWIVWHERPTAAWRALVGGIWVLATPFLDGSALAPSLSGWVVCELVVMVAFVADAWRRPAARSDGTLLTGWAAAGRRAPA